MDNKTKNKRNYFIILQEQTFFESDSIKSLLVNDKRGTEIILSYLWLINYAKNKNGIICNQIGDNVKELTIKEIQNILYFVPNKKRVEQILNTLIENKLLTKTKHGKGNLYEIVNIYESIGSQSLAAEEKRNQRAKAKAKKDEELRTQALEQLNKPTAYELEQKHMKDLYGEPQKKPQIALDESLQSIFRNIKQR